MNVSIYLQSLWRRIRRTRVQASLVLLIVAFLVALAAQSIYTLLVATDFGARLRSALVAFTLILLIPPFARRQRLARWWVSAFLLAHGAWVYLATDFSEIVRFTTLAVDLCLAATLMLPSSAQIFRGNEGLPALRRSLPLGLSLLGVALLSSLMRLLGLDPFLLQTMNIVMVACLVVALQSRDYFRFVDVFAATPADIPEAEAKKFRRACWLRAIDAHGRALAVLNEVSDCSSARLLRGLIEFERVEQNPGLARLIFDSEYLPTAKETADIQNETLDTERCVRLVAERNMFIDALVNASPEVAAFFDQELASTLERLSGRHFVGEGHARIENWWERVSRTSSHGREVSWLIARLWEANCTRSAKQLAADTKDETWTRVLSVATLIETANDDEETLPPVVHRQAEAACLVPMLSEWAGLYLLDSTICAERGADFVARQILSRPMLIDSLRRLWSDYSDVCSVRPAGLLAILTGYRSGLFVSRRGFDEWWNQEKRETIGYESKLAAGLQWAAIGDWTDAHNAFNKASEWNPHSPSARYNRAFCLIEMNRLGDAERLLSDLVQDEPEEALWWVRLGDTRRLMLDNAGALAAYRKALKLTGDAPDLLARIVSVLVAEGRELEAQQLIRESALTEGEQGRMLEEFVTTASLDLDLETWGDDDESPPSVH